MTTLTARTAHRYGVAAILDDNGFVVGRVAVSISHPSVADLTGPTFATMEEARDAAAEPITDPATAEDERMAALIHDGMRADQAYFLAECYAAEGAGHC